MTNNLQPDEFDNDWQDCEPGTLSEFVQKNEAINRRDLLIKVGATSAGIVALLGGSLYLFQTEDGTNPDKTSGTEFPLNNVAVTKIRCKKVVELLPEYVAGTISDQTLLARLEKHLGYCRPCIKKRDQLV